MSAQSAKQRATRQGTTDMGEAPSSYKLGSITKEPAEPSIPRRAMLSMLLPLCATASAPPCLRLDGRRVPCAPQPTLDLLRADWANIRGGKTPAECKRNRSTCARGRGTEKTQRTRSVAKEEEDTERPERQARTLASSQRSFASSAPLRLFVRFRQPRGVYSAFK